MDESAIQKAGAVQRTPCIPEQIADHQKVPSHLKTRLTMF